MSLNQAIEELELAFAPSQQSERLAQVTLERYWWLLWMNPTRRPSGDQATYKQIPIGIGDREYIPDFLVLNNEEPSFAYTTDTIWRFVELEAPGAALITQSGSLSQKLRAAYEQILDWGQWLGTHRFAVKELSWSRRTPRFEYLIFAGRRSMAEESDWRRVSSFVEANRAISLEVHTYDHLLTRAREMGEDVWEFYCRSNSYALGMKEFKKQIGWAYDSASDALVLKADFGKLKDL